MTTLARPGSAFFINEEGEVYQHRIETQANAFPGDDHVPYATSEAAEQAALKQGAEQIIGEHFYEKCRDCHLFIEPNGGWTPGSEIAEFMHLSRGNSSDERLDASHEPVPSGMKANLATWKVLGPVEMRERFVTPAEYVELG